MLARRFYNDAVRDTRALRAVLFTRIFGLAGRAALPDYFEIAEYPAPHRPAEPGPQPGWCCSIAPIGCCCCPAPTRRWIRAGGSPQVAESRPVRSCRHRPPGTRRGDRPAARRATSWSDRSGDGWRGSPSPGSTTSRPSSISPRRSSIDDRSAPDAVAATTPPVGGGGRRSVARFGVSGRSRWRTELDVSGHTDLERLTLTGHRWWTAEDADDHRRAGLSGRLAQRLPEVLGLVAIRQRPGAGRRGRLTSARRRVAGPDHAIGVRSATKSRHPGGSATVTRSAGPSVIEPPDPTDGARARALEEL